MVWPFERKSIRILRMLVFCYQQVLPVTYSKPVGTMVNNDIHIWNSYGWNQLLWSCVILWWNLSVLLTREDEYKPASGGLYWFGYYFCLSKSVLPTTTHLSCGSVYLISVVRKPTFGGRGSCNENTPSYSIFPTFY